MIVDRRFECDGVAEGLGEMGWLNRGMMICLRDERTDREVTFYFEGGLVSFVRYLNKGRGRLMARPVSTVRELDDLKVELAVQYNDGWNPTEVSLANRNHTVDGRMHIPRVRNRPTRPPDDHAAQG